MKAQKKLIIGALLTFFVIILLSFTFLKDRSDLIGQEDFEKLIQNAKSFEVDEGYIYFLSNNNRYKIIKDDQLLRQITAPIQIRTNYFWFWVWGILGFVILSFGGIFFLYKKEKSYPTPNKQSSPKLSPPSSPAEIRPIKPNTNITLNSLAGIGAVKNELKEIIEYLHNPSPFDALNLRMPKGVLLVGPPGVGKTMIAKALANEAGVPFFYQSGSSFSQIFVGSGAKRVQELFAQAKACKSAIIFIDEIDSVGKKRGFGRNDERESTLNQLLTEIDGFMQSSNLIVIGATNNAEVLDPALLRSGRFDRKIYIDLPTPKEREEILCVYLAHKPHQLNIPQIAQECSGFSGAMIENLINEAGLLMLREKRHTLTQEDIFNAKHKIIHSLKKIPSINPTQKQLLCLYQGAKAFFALKHKIHFEKVALWEEECIWNLEHFLTQEEALNLLSFYLSGYTALLQIENTKLTYAKEDLKKAKNFANEIVQECGMGKELLFEDSSNLIQSCLASLHSFFDTHQQEVSLLSQKLCTQESLSFEEIKSLF